MKTSEADKSGNKCPKYGGKTTQDLKNRGFVRHLEAFPPTDPTVPRGKRGQCAYGRHDVDESLSN
jgi:hypothetical protein